jgi:hypothetical protein
MPLSALSTGREGTAWKTDDGTGVIDRMGRYPGGRLTRAAIAASRICVASVAVAAVLANGAASAAPLAPTAHTGETSGVTTSTGTLYGLIHPGGPQTSFFFRYGMTSSYGMQTPVMVAGSGTAQLDVKAAVTGLTAGTTYHYRLVAVNAEGITGEGEDRTFTTKKIPLAFTIAAGARRDLFGAPFSVSGTLTGTESADRPVILLASPFPYVASFKPFSSVQSTNAAGFFSFSVNGLSQSTEFRVATVEAHPVQSEVVLERIAVRVSLHVHEAARPGFVRLYGVVEPVQALAVVDFQLLRPDRSPKTVASALISGHSSGNSRFTSGNSRFSRVVRISRPGLYRAYVRVGSGAQASNHSRAILIG